MTTERTSHRIDETGDMFCASEDEWVDASAKQGWEAVYNWGKKGWDIGGSYVTCSWRPRPDGLWDASVSVEGDLTIIEGATAAERDAWLDVQAAFHWLVDQSQGPVDDHRDAEGNVTEHQDWKNRVNLATGELHKHLTSSSRESGRAVEDGHYLYGLPAETYGGALWEIHHALHVKRAVDEGRTVTDDELVDWMDPDWRGPFSWARCDADKEEIA